ncbi:YrhC family protein [Alkalihalobacillus sp. 1P02AB]|uniref:YrhC family protein n=1 Tax=Alkalihalobacillus sp. 1P02AB TaxID=3132260 RepID=UPI0039A50E81
MNEKELQELEGKIDDYNRFRFILLSLSTILFLGIIVPVEGKALWVAPLLIIGVFLMLSFACLCHYLTKKAESELYDN